MSESSKSAIFDSRTTNIVTGESWMNTYEGCLDDKDKAKIFFCDTTNIYCFDNRKTIPATKKCTYTTCHRKQTCYFKH